MVLVELTLDTTTRCKTQTATMTGDQEYSNARLHNATEQPILLAYWLLFTLPPLVHYLHFTYSNPRIQQLVISMKIKFTIIEHDYYNTGQAARKTKSAKLRNLSGAK